MSYPNDEKYFYQFVVVKQDGDLFVKLAHTITELAAKDLVRVFNDPAIYFYVSKAEWKQLEKNRLWMNSVQP